MKEVKILSSKYYPNGDEKDYGDCILINTGNELIIYDCGSYEHANEVIKYMKLNNFNKAIIILSHNDSDHFNGIKTLIENNKISVIYTTLLLKYKTEIDKIIADGRKSDSSISDQLLEVYSNIAELAGENIVDIYETSTLICPGVEIVGPEKKYMLETVAKRLDSRESDSIDGETAVNATSIQISVDFGNEKLLLCGDCSYRAIEDKISNYTRIQLPHHGKEKQANLIFEKMNTKVMDVKYYISDNTGNKNAGSDNTDVRGKNVKNTRIDGDIIIDISTIKSSGKVVRKLGIY